VQFKLLSTFYDDLVVANNL